MKNVKINNKWDILLPEHRADRPEWYTEKGWERKRLDSMHHYLHNGDTIFYVGSEEGEMPALCQMWGAKVVMFEPNDKVWPNTKVIWEANNLEPPMATLEGFASDKTTSNALLHLGSFPPSADGEIISNHAFKELVSAGDIPQIRIDDVPDIVPTAISIDVEGSEFFVLKGAEQTLKNYKPLIWLSLHPEFMFRMFGHYQFEIRKWVKDLGYDEHLLDYDHEAHFLFTPNGITHMTIVEIEAQAKLDSPEEVFLERAKERGLINSIKENGILHPIMLDKESFVNGQHRFTVAKHLGFKTVPVIQR